jgi:hypothetical protein
VVYPTSREPHLLRKIVFKQPKNNIVPGPLGDDRVVFSFGCLATTINLRPDLQTLLHIFVNEDQVPLLDTKSWSWRNFEKIQ